MPDREALSIILSKLLMLLLISSLSVDSRRKLRSSKYLCSEGSQTRLYQPAATNTSKPMLAGRKRLRNRTSVGIWIYSIDFCERAQQVRRPSINRNEVAAIGPLLRSLIRNSHPHPV